MIRLILFFTTVSAILCSTTFLILKKRLQLTASWNLLLAFFIAFIFLSLILGPLLYRTTHVNPSELWSYAFQMTQYFLMGWIGVLFIVFGALEIIQSITRVFDPQKRIFLTEGVARGLLASVSVAAGVGLFQAKSGPAVQKVKLVLPKLPDEFAGLKIAQISDVHIGPLLHQDFLKSVVNQVNQLEPDLIFITGDLVDGTVDQLREHIAPLTELKSKEGIYFCTGNHEYYSGAVEWVEHLETLGVHVFKNSNRVLSRGESKILIAGVHDFQASKMEPTHTSDPYKAAESSEPVHAKLLLAHNPFSIEDAAKAGFDVQFSGHTHAGQFYPFAWITRAILKHFEGLYQINEKTQLYVNRGTGYWGPPNRLGKRSEITEFTLTAKS